MGSTHFYFQHEGPKQINRIVAIWTVAIVKQREIEVHPKLNNFVNIWNATHKKMIPVPPFSRSSHYYMDTALNTVSNNGTCTSVNLKDYHLDPQNIFGSSTKATRRDEINDIYTFNLKGGELESVRRQFDDKNYQKIRSVSVEGSSCKVTGNDYYFEDTIPGGRYSTHYKLNMTDLQDYVRNMYATDESKMPIIDASQVEYFNRDQLYIYDPEHHFLLGGAGLQIKGLHPDEYLTYMYPKKELFGFFTSFGRFMFRSNQFYYVDLYEDARFYAKCWKPYYQGFTLLYVIKDDGYLFKLEKKGNFLSLEREEQVKAKLDYITCMRNGTPLFRTVGGDWIIRNSNVDTGFPFLKFKTTFGKITNIHTLLGLKPKERRKPVKKSKLPVLEQEQLPRCIDMYGHEDVYVAFLLDNFSFFYTFKEGGKKKQVKFNFTKIDLMPLFTSHVTEQVLKPSNCFEIRDLVVGVQRLSSFVAQFSVYVKRRKILTRDFLSALDHFASLVPIVQQEDNMHQLSDLQIISFQPKKEIE